MDLIEKAEKMYLENFDRSAYFGRCIFLSFYCERGTCDFCFRSTQKHKIRHIEKARRSIPSILAEAALIRGLDWKLEFLTGGYGVYPFEDILKVAKHCHEILKRKFWVNLGVLEKGQMRQLKPYTEGIVSSLETLNPELHNKVCPDKPIEPYLQMMDDAEELGFRQSFTLVIGLGETRDDFRLVKELIERKGFERITIYALRPVAGTPYTKGPEAEELAWWIASTRVAFPGIEIIAGTAIYRLDEVSLLLRAGANAITKLPATKMFNTPEADMLKEQVRKAGRNFTSTFTSPDIRNHADWKGLIGGTSLSEEEKAKVFHTLDRYLQRMGNGSS